MLQSFALTRNKKIGITLTLLPLLLLVAVLMAYSVLTISVSMIPSADYAKLNLILMGVNGLSLVALIGAIILGPLGLYYLARRDEDRIAQLKQKEELKNLPPEQLEYLAGWSWGGFFGSFIWPLGNKMPLWVLLAFVPIIQVFVAYKLGISGRELSWENSSWKSFESFKQRQKIIGVIIVIVLILGGLIEYYNWE